MDAETVEFPNLPDRLRGLGDLAENLWWSWHPSAKMLFKMLDPQAWKKSGHNPDKMLREMPAEIFNAAANDDYLRNYDLVLSQFHRYLSDKSCRVLDNFPYTPNTYAIAYFSPEHGLHRSLPFYAGGLGFLAGDQIKECSDLSVPLVAVGFMYHQGYLHQQIREDGWPPIQIIFAGKAYPVDDPGKRIIQKVFNADGPASLNNVPPPARSNP